MIEVVEQFKDGIYFGLDESIYHKQMRLSSSGVCDMLVSPADFWADSWLNPDREDEDEDEETVAQIVGRAYHHARFEPARFVTGYASLPDPVDYGDKLLTTHSDIKEKLESLGQAKTKAGEKVLDAAFRLEASGYEGPIWHIIDAEAAQEREEKGLIGLQPKVWREIERDMKRLHGNKYVAPLVTDGEAEVSVFWTDKRGVKWKVRFDYLRERAITDLKTFDNAMGKHLDQCVNDAIRFNRYYVKAALYWQAAERIRNGDLAIKKVQNQAQKDLIDAIRESEDVFEYWWLFQQKKGIPNVLARRFRMTAEIHPHHLYQAPDAEGREDLKRKIKKPSRLFAKAQLEIEWARDTFLNCMEIWPDQPWGSLNPVADVTDEDFPPFFLEG